MNMAYGEPYPINYNHNYPIVVTPSINTNHIKWAPSDYYISPPTKMVELAGKEYAISLKDEHGDFLLGIKYDGTIEGGRNYTPNTAARILFDTLQGMAEAAGKTMPCCHQCQEKM